MLKKTHSLLFRWTDRTFFLLLNLLLFASPLVYCSYSDNIFRVPKEVFVLVSITLSFALWLIKEIERSQEIIFSQVVQNLIKTPFFKSLIFILLASCLSMINSTVKMVSVINIINISLYFLFYLTLINTISSVRQTSILLTTAISSAVLTSIYCIFQYFGHDPLFYPINPNDSGSYLATGFLDNANLAAGFLSLFTPLLLYKIISSNSLLHKFIHLFCLGLILVAIIFTGNRISLAASSFSSLFFLIVLFILKKKRNDVKIFFYLLLIAVLLSSYPLYKKGTFVNLLSIPTSFSESTNDRIIFWRATGEMIKDYPFIGIGIGTFKLHYLKYRKRTLEKKLFFGELERTEQAHNDYLQLWAETGLLGLLAGIWFLCQYFAYSFQTVTILNKQKKEAEVIQVLSLLSASFSILIYAITTFPFHLAPISLCFTFLVGFIVCLRKNAESSKS